MPGVDPIPREFERAGCDDADVVVSDDERGAGLTAESVEALLDAADICTGSRVLDVTTSAGHVARAAARRGADVIGADFAAARIRMPFDADSFDAVVDGLGVCRCPNPDAALREALRVLKPGGRVAFIVRDVPERAAGCGMVPAAASARGSIAAGSSPGPSRLRWRVCERSRQALLAAGFVAPCCRRLPTAAALAAAFKPWRVTDAPAGR